MPSEHITKISLSSTSLSYTTRLIFSKIPAGNDKAFMICTFPFCLMYVGQAPFLINSILPAYRSSIAISNVA